MNARLLRQRTSRRAAGDRSREQFRNIKRLNCFGAKNCCTMASQFQAKPLAWSRPRGDGSQVRILSSARVGSLAVLGLAMSLVVALCSSGSASASGSGGSTYSVMLENILSGPQAVDDSHLHPSLSSCLSRHQGETDRLRRQGHGRRQPAVPAPGGPGSCRGDHRRPPGRRDRCRAGGYPGCRCHRRHLHACRSRPAVPRPCSPAWP